MSGAVQAAPFEITRSEHGQHGSDGTRIVTLLDADGKMFKRRAIKGVGTAVARNVEWLVVELGGVRVYCSEQGVVVTRQDLMP